MNALKHDTREGWLIAAIGALDEKFFAENGYDLPERLQVSCGFPVGGRKAIGQCWSPENSADQTTHMFVSPALADRVSVLATLLHEIIHAVVGLAEGHKGNFRKLAKDFGLAGKMTATFAEEETELYFTLTIIGDRLCAYPHATLTPPEKKAGKGGSGWVRLMSENDEGIDYKVVISPKFIEAHGFPMDPWGNAMIEVPKDG